MMTARNSGLKCPHCGTPLQAIEFPEAASWGKHHYVCFNDECSYYQEGWTWMWDNYAARASYRYRVIDLESGIASPLPVWSKDAMRELIVDDAAGSPEARDPETDNTRPEESDQ